MTPTPRFAPSPLRSLPLVVVWSLLAGCSGGDAEAPAAQPLVLSPENVVTVETGRVAAGPALAGTLAARVSATVRAEVAGTVLAVRFEEGETVAAGAVLARVDAPALREAVLSAESAVHAAEQEVAVAGRNAARAESLLRAGAVSEREAETARWAASNAEAAAAAARSRLALVREQVAKTEVRSPIAGRVSRRPVSVGDTVSPGAEMFTVVDATTLELEATVPAERLGELRVGAPVTFGVRGYPGESFAGVVDRINPVAEAATRQVGLYVRLPNPGGRLLAGLFAEGRVLNEVRDGLTLPLSALDESGAVPVVSRIRDGVVEQVEVGLGLRDEPAERVEVLSGLRAGDLVITGAARGVAAGTAVELAPGR